MLEITMAATEANMLGALVAANEKEILPEWLELQKKAGTLKTGRITEPELLAESKEFLGVLSGALSKGSSDSNQAAYQPARDFLRNISHSRALQGFSPTETATFVFSLKQPLFNWLNRDKSVTPADAAKIIWAVTILLDG